MGRSLQQNICYTVHNIINETALHALLKDERRFRLRRKQLLNHYFNHLTKDPAAMSDIGNQAVEIVDVAYSSPILQVATTQVGDNGTTIKTLFELQDKERIESVLMLYPDRSTLCISSQVGCAMACPFCATGGLGLTRNLTSDEIVEQVWFAAKECVKLADQNDTKPLTNIVFMGMGEPTQNLDAIFKALKYICGDYSLDGNPVRNSQNDLNFGISPRNITISTVGDVKGIKTLADFPLPLRLAVSLHAPTDELRDELVPMNKKYNIAAVLENSYDYYVAKKRRVSIEYALMRDINDSEKQAFQLAKILNRQGNGNTWAHVNLIPLNEVPGSKWTASTPEATETFIATLKSKGIPVTLRDSRGSDIDGACGQLSAVWLA